MVLSEHELDGIRNPSRGAEERRIAAVAAAEQAAEMQNAAFKVRSIRWKYAHGSSVLLLQLQHACSYRMRDWIFKV